MLTYVKTPLSLSDPLFDKIVNKITESYPKSCVLWIDEILNDELYARYIAQKEILENKYGKVQEYRVFHGTKLHCIDAIAEEGFKAELNVTSAYGKGTYFAKTAAMSSGYMATTTDICYMFFCDILVGEKCSWARKTGAPGEVYVDSEKNTNIFVVPDDNSTYPRYIIAFHKNPQY